MEKYIRFSTLSNKIYGQPEIYTYASAFIDVPCEKIMVLSLEHCKLLDWCNGESVLYVNFDNRAIPLLNNFYDIEIIGDHIGDLSGVTCNNIKVCCRTFEKLPDPTKHKVWLKLVGNVSSSGILSKIPSGLHYLDLSNTNITNCSSIQNALVGGLNTLILRNTNISDCDCPGIENVENLDLCGTLVRNVDNLKSILFLNYRDTPAELN